LHERMALMNELIGIADADGDLAVALADRTSDVDRLFGNEENLLLAVRHRWVTMLTAKLDQAVYEDIPADRARTQVLAANPGLAALLDMAGRRSVRVRSLRRGEKHIVDVYSGPHVSRRSA
jgi:ATP adenylyltransferase